MDSRLVHALHGGLYDCIKPSRVNETLDKRYTSVNGTVSLMHGGFFWCANLSVRTQCCKKLLAEQYIQHSLAQARRIKDAMHLFGIKLHVKLSCNGFKRFIVQQYVCMH